MPFGRRIRSTVIRDGSDHPRDIARDRIRDMESGWFAARPFGKENIYKIYAESFRGADHLRLTLEQAQTIVNGAIAAVPGAVKGLLAAQQRKVITASAERTINQKDKSYEFEE
jgi:hypothetical protein